MKMLTDEFPRCPKCRHEVDAIFFEDGEEFECDFCEEKLIMHIEYDENDEPIYSVSFID